jgi:3-demethoxyubiquinol 3-hydroxylase
MTPDRLIVLYDGACPLCRREIAHLQRLAAARGGAGLDFVDVADGRACPLPTDVSRQQLLARFHVQAADGRLLDGAAAFVAMWSRLPGWRWLARLASWPGALPLMEFSYRGFLRVRPALQRLALRREAASDRTRSQTGPRP